MDPVTVNLKEFTRLSGLSRATVYEMIHDGAVQSVLIMGRRLIVLDSYRQLVAAQLPRP